MDWQQIQNSDDLERFDKLSHRQPVLIYKHSSRCHICTMALNRIERGWDSDDYSKVTPVFLDVVGSRDISNTVAERYGVSHESPQALVIRNGRCVLSESHSGITYKGIMDAAS